MPLMGRILVADPSVSGISGDMLLGALLELGAPEERLQMCAGVISELAGGELRVEVERCTRKGIACTGVATYTAARLESWDEMQEVLGSAAARLSLSNPAVEFAEDVLELLIKAERAVHGSAEPHELGSADTLLDILGTAALLDSLELFGCTVLSAPVNTGRGRIETSHGELSVPVPVVQEVLRMFSIPFLSTHGGELTTPTGIALLACLADEFVEELPVMRVESTGRGAGSRELEAAPNMLQLHLCTSCSLEKEQIALLETSVDDVSGELVGHAVGKLMEAGALDVQVFQGLTKKNRPSMLVQVVCKPGREDELAELMMRELGTLGVRCCRMSMRFVLERRMETVELELLGRRFSLRVKVARNAAGEVVSAKPEYEELRRLAEALSLPLRQVQRLVSAELAKLF